MDEKISLNELQDLINKKEVKILQDVVKLLEERQNVNLNKIEEAAEAIRKEYQNSNQK